MPDSDGWVPVRKDKLERPTLTSFFDWIFRGPKELGFANVQGCVGGMSVASYLGLKKWLGLDKIRANQKASSEDRQTSRSGIYGRLGEHIVEYYVASDLPVLANN